MRKHQGEDVNIVETTDERQIVPLLREALKVKIKRNIRDNNK